MTVLLDTCIIVDALQKRDPFFEDAEKILLLCSSGQCAGVLTAKSLTDIYYLSHKLTHNDQMSRLILSKLCAFLNLLNTEATDLYQALASNISDFEDAVMMETVKRAKVDCIVTRNEKDYKDSPVPVYGPKSFLDLFKGTAL